MELQRQINELTVKREQIKLELFACEALRAKYKENWVIYKESTPLQQRVELDAKIATLLEDRQSSKLKLIQLKMLRAKNRDTTFMSCVKSVLEEAGMEKELVKIHEIFHSLYKGD